MKLSLASLASSSSGNCYVVFDEKTCILYDCGISFKRISEGLGALSLPTPQAILISHAHCDHVKSASMLIKKCNIPLYITEGAFAESGLEKSDAIHIIGHGQEFSVGSICITPFQTSHDASDAVAYSFRSGADKASVITDTGFISEDMLKRIFGSSSVIIEANHDPDMLKNGPYPYYLKKRIYGDEGHLSNAACAEACTFLYKNGTKSFMLAHLSEHCNTPEKAYDTVCGALKKCGEEFTLKIASKSTPCVL